MCQDSGLSHIYKLIVCSSEKILNNIKTSSTGKQFTFDCCSTTGLYFAITPLGLHSFVSKETREEKMPTSCISPHRCGTHSKGWLKGAHPEEHEGKVARKVPATTTETGQPIAVPCSFLQCLPLY